MTAPNHSKLAIEAYRATFEEAYQSGSRYRGRVMEKTGVEALVEHMPVIGVADTNQRTSGQDVTLANLDNARPMARLKPWEAFDLIDKQSKAVTNVDDMRAYGMTLGKSVSRQFDEPIFQALEKFDPLAYSRPGMADGVTTTTGATGAGQYGNPEATHAVATTNAANWTHVIASATQGQVVAADIAKMRTALLAEDFDVDAQDVTFAYDHSLFNSLSQDDKLRSFDFLQQGAGTGNVTATGEFGQIYGAMPIGVGGRGRRAGHGKIPTNRAYMFVRNAIGLCVGTTENLGVFDWIPMKRGWLIGGEANAGATRIQNAGIVVLIY